LPNHSFMQLSPDERLLTPAEQLDYAGFLHSPAVVQRPGSLAPSVVAEVCPEQLLTQELLDLETISWASEDYKTNSLIQLKVQVGSQLLTWYLLAHVGKGFEPAQFAAVYDQEAPARAAFTSTAENDYDPERIATTVQEMIAAAQYPHMQN
jgi:hypothetical protein